MSLQTYWLESLHAGVPTLGAHTNQDEVPCPAYEHGHWGRARLARRDEDAYDSTALWADPATPWPTICERCGADFSAQKWYRSSGFEHLYRHKVTGEELLLRDALPGAVYFAPWLDTIFTPQRAHCINVILPDGATWTIDAAASNCSIPDDHKQIQHHCWVIDPNSDLDHLTVGKDGGPTCAAGAGSIQTSNWHGFLRNGWLVE